MTNATTYEMLARIESITTWTDARLDRLEAETDEAMGNLFCCEENFAEHCRLGELLEAIQYEKGRRAGAANDSTGIENPRDGRLKAEYMQLDRELGTLAHVARTEPAWVEPRRAEIRARLTEIRQELRRADVLTAIEMDDAAEADESGDADSPAEFERHVAGMSDHDLVFHADPERFDPMTTDRGELAIIVTELRHRLAKALGMNDGPND